MNHDSVVEDWRNNAESNDEENYQFLRSMKWKDYGFEPDELAGELHKQAFQIVDCTRCANCCKTMDITFNEDDVDRIAAHLEMSADEFVAKYLEADDEDEPYKARRKPCPFLGDNNLCTIYDVRPAVCREYPHTDKEGFTFRTMGVAGNALVCPAVFWIVEEMKEEAWGWDQMEGCRSEHQSLETTHVDSTETDSAAHRFQRLFSHRHELRLRNGN